MGKIKKVISVNLLALFGLFNIFIQGLYYYEVYRGNFGFGGDVTWMFLLANNILLIMIALFILLIEYLCISPNAKWAFKFPYEKIRPQILYNIFFFGGLIGIVLPLIAITLFTILQ